MSICSRSPLTLGASPVQNEHCDASLNSTILSDSNLVDESTTQDKDMVDATNLGDNNLADESSTQDNTMEEDTNLGNNNPSDKTCPEEKSPEEKSPEEKSPEEKSPEEKNPKGKGRAREVTPEPTFVSCPLTLAKTVVGKHRVPVGLASEEPFWLLTSQAYYAARRVLYKCADGALLKNKKKLWGSTWLREAFVALSCVLDLASEHVHPYVPKKMLRLARDKCLDLWQPKLDLNFLTIIRSLIPELDRAGSIEQFRRYLFARRPFAEKSVEFPILKALEWLCYAIENKGKMVAVTYSMVWTQLVMAFKGDGEFWGSNAGHYPRSTRTIMRNLAKWYGAHARIRGRTSLVVWNKDGEWMACDGKKDGSMPSDLRQQHSRNIRVNRTIAEKHKFDGLEAPHMIYLSFGGTQARVCALVPFQDIYVADVVDFLELPNNMKELRELLGHGALFSAVLEIARHIARLIEEVRVAKEAKVLEKAREEERAREAERAKEAERAERAKQGILTEDVEMKEKTEEEIKAEERKARKAKNRLLWFIYQGDKRGVRPEPTSDDDPDNDYEKDPLYVEHEPREAVFQNSVCFSPRLLYENRF
ncbi:hypothetical protein BGZ94_002765 [Podila epigama]|nr:hypothetical protein BGZ94_002765 [Podila epigama]